jgi:hypothetical protein
VNERGPHFHNIACMQNQAERGLISKVRSDSVDETQRGQVPAARLRGGKQKHHNLCLKLHRLMQVARMQSTSCPQRTDVSLLRGHVEQQLPQGSSAAALHLQVRVLQPTSQHACSTPSRCTSVRMAPCCSGHACGSCKTQCMAAWLAGGRHVAPHALAPQFTHAADASSITHCLLPALQWHMALVLRPWKF